MWLSRLGTLSITAIQGALAVDTLEEHPHVRPEPKTRQVVVQFEPRPPITEFELRNGILRVTPESVKPAADKAGSQS